MWIADYKPRCFPHCVSEWVKGCVMQNSRPFPAAEILHIYKLWMGLHGKFKQSYGQYRQYTLIVMTPTVVSDWYNLSCFSDRRSGRWYIRNTRPRSPHPPLVRKHTMKHTKYHKIIMQKKKTQLKKKGIMQCHGVFLLNAFNLPPPQRECSLSSSSLRLPESGTGRIDASIGERDHPG